MAPPTKRRKKDSDVESSPSKARNLDFFFGKQKVGRLKKLLPSPSPGPEASRDTTALTDEELARKLQEQWNKEGSAEREEAANATADDPSERHCAHGLERNGDGTEENEAERLLEDATAQHQEAEKPTEAEKSRFVGNGFFAPKNSLSLQSAAAAEDTVTATIPLDEPLLSFDPNRYVPDLQKQWASEGGCATYALLTRCFVLASETQSRIKIVDTITNLLRILIEADPASLLPAVWLATNSIAPPYVNLELGLGGSAISKALKKVCGLDQAALKSLYDKHGDAGDVAFEAKKRQSITLKKPKPLTIKGVYDSLVRIANSKGNGSVENKQRIVEKLVQDARGAEESRYVVRTLVQHLRIGAVRTTMLIGLSRAFLMSRPPDAKFSGRPQKELAGLKKESLVEVWSKAEETVKACFARHPNYNDLVPALLEVGVCDELLLRCGLGLHVPLRPMLGSITRDLGEMLTKLQGRDFCCEYKYDGQRAQVHCDEKGKVTIFSRHLEIMTDKYPDLVALVPEIRGEGVSSFIMEGEVVAVDRESGELKTFQTLANRARKDVVIGSVKIDVCLFAFDLMYLNGQELLGRPFRERRGLLRSLFVEKPQHFTWVKSMDATSADSEGVLEFFKGALEIKCEGIMVKVLDNLANPDLVEMAGNEFEEETAKAQAPPTPSKRGRGKAKAKSKEDREAEKEKGGRRKALLSTYEPDKRVDSWLKVKKDYDTAADTLDVVPVGAWHGQGRKSKWWSPMLLAVRNPESGSLEAVTKCMAGFTDKFYQANVEKYAPGSSNVISKPAYVDYGGGAPDVWFEPQEVWELAFADITLSPTYTAAIGLVSEERGLSLRFPRFLRVREDKGIEEASTADFLATLWRKQRAKAPQGEGESKEDVDDGG